MTLSSFHGTACHSGPTPRQQNIKQNPKITSPSQQNVLALTAAELLMREERGAGVCACVCACMCVCFHVCVFTGPPVSLVFQAMQKKTTHIVLKVGGRTGTEQLPKTKCRVRLGKGLPQQRTPSASESPL